MTIRQTGKSDVQARVADVRSALAREDAKQQAEGASPGDDAAPPDDGAAPGDDAIEGEYRKV